MDLGFVSDQMVEVVLGIDSRTELKKFLRRPDRYVIAASAAQKKGRGEVNIKQLTSEERAKFDTAKEKEIATWMKYKVCKAVARSEAGDLPLLQMRWVLTWKSDGAAKARLVLRGYQVDNLTSIETAAPTPSRRARHLFLLECARLGLKVYKGDAKAAFLQGDLSDSTVFATPAPELAKSLGMSQAEVIKFEKCVYGLVDAPRRWHARVVRDLTARGWTPMVLEPCVMVLRDAQGRTIAICTWHVDDFLVAGRVDDPIWKTEFDAIRGLYEWSDWQTGKIEQCGLWISQHQDHSFTLDQSHYLAEVQPIEVHKTRRQELGNPLTVAERSRSAALIGELMWFQSQVGLAISGDLSILQGRMANGTGHQLMELNKLLAKAKVCAQTPLRI